VRFFLLFFFKPGGPPYVGQECEPALLLMMAVAVDNVCSKGCPKWSITWRIPTFVVTVNAVCACPFHKACGIDIGVFAMDQEYKDCAGFVLLESHPKGMLTGPTFPAVPHMVPLC
jgi:hypothetical protein